MALENGGDPARLTIAGQSAGAQSVFALMASALTAGLFSGAIEDPKPLTPMLKKQA